MKNYRFLREFVPYASIALLMGGGLIADRMSISGKAAVDTEILFPKKVAETEVPQPVKLYKGDIAVLNMGDHGVTGLVNGKPLLEYVTEYECLKFEEIESIVYTEDNQNLTIKLIDSDVYYVGHYDSLKKQYVYEKIGDMLVEIPKQYTKK